ncbi:MAG: pyrroline-5-carboxylate reductase [Candidatus Sumerlaeota bacterium]|nr:pyrroline-5-carboxylate reductase [Candidatus Sumerlaeota bacterium]
MLNQRIGFIGAGNMASAIISGMLRAGLVAEEQIVVSDISTEQLRLIEGKTRVRTLENNAWVVDRSDVIIFCVKPFHMANVCAELQPYASPDKLFISICAGITTPFIEERLGGGADAMPVRVVRVMSNTPALVGCGAAAIAPGRHASTTDVALAVNIFQSVGTTVVLEEEKLDVVTGLSGSGPAYFFYFAEALIVAGIELGLTESESRMLVMQTFLGAARMAHESGMLLGELRAAVTTKGGTTEAGLRALDESGFIELAYRCVENAARRSRELSKQ